VSFEFNHVVPRHLFVKPRNGENSHPLTFGAYRNFYRHDSSENRIVDAVEAKLEYVQKNALCFSHNDTFLVYLEHSGVTELMRGLGTLFRATCMSNGVDVFAFDSTGQVANRIIIGEIKTIELRVSDAQQQILCVAVSFSSSQVKLIEINTYRWYDYFDPTVPDANDLELEVLSLKSILTRLVASCRIAINVNFQ
jgi:hypothetical protein